MTAGRWRRFACALVAALSLALGLAPTSAHAADLASLIDDLVRQGDDKPQEALDSLEELGNTSASTLAQKRELLTGEGLVAARNGRSEDALAKVDALRALTPNGDELAAADAHLIRGQLAVNGGHGEAAYEQARAALPLYTALCGPGGRRRVDCDYRAWYRVLELAERGASEQGNSVVAAGYTQAMVDLARRNGDRRREALALAVSALMAEDNADPASANRLIAQAQRLAHFDGAPWVEVGVAVLDGLLHHRRQQPEVTQRDYEGALEIAEAADMKRSAMLLRANLSDVYIHENRPGDALAAIDLALPVARQHSDLRTERLLLHNATLAKLALGRVAEAKLEMTHVLELWQRDTGPGQQQEALREFGDALAKAGDTVGALDLFHREESLAIQIRAANKAAAEAELQTRYDQESQKRRIELLARDNQLKSVELDNQALARHLWMFAGAAMVLMAVLAVLMVLRMRELNRTLVEHETLLRSHTERDALTGLANRRQFREVMRQRGTEKNFKGALMMVDVDHFKRINDHHGHAAGDRVLTEVSRRLAGAMRGDDLVARWGGEEFLVFAPGIRGAELEALAERVRAAVDQKPVTLPSEATIACTVSIGYGAFPVPGSQDILTWEQAVNLVDLALYAAKNQGRNRAVAMAAPNAAAGEPPASAPLEPAAPCTAIDTA